MCRSRKQGRLAPPRVIAAPQTGRRRGVFPHARPGIGLSRASERDSECSEPLAPAHPQEWRRAARAGWLDPTAHRHRLPSKSPARRSPPLAIAAHTALLKYPCARPSRADSGPGGLPAGPFPCKSKSPIAHTRRAHPVPLSLARSPPPEQSSELKRPDERLRSWYSLHGIDFESLPSTSNNTTASPLCEHLNSARIISRLDGV